MRKNLKNIAIGAALVASPFLMAQGAQAESKTASIKASINETLSLTLSSNSMDFELGGSELYTESIDVTGRTNSANGYTISFNVNNDYNDLKHSNSLVSDLISSIPSAKTESDFPEKSWGYSISTENHVFQKVPLSPKNVFATARQGQNAHNFTVGIKGSNNLVAGDYENELLFTIIANPITEPEPQTGADPEIILDDKAKAILGTNNNLNFVYDENTYTVGETYTDNLGETTIAGVWAVPVNGCNYELCQSGRSSNVTSVNFSDSFYDFKPTSLKEWFYNYFVLSTITNPQNLNASEATSMRNMFHNAGYNSDIYLDLTSWDVGKVTDMYQAFAQVGQYGQYVYINVDNWDVSNVVDMEGLFNDVAFGAPYATIKADNWNAVSVTNLSEAFDYISAGVSRSVGDSYLNISAKNFKAPRATDATYLFYGVGYQTATVNLDLSGFNLASIKNTRRFFEESAKYSKKADIDLSYWDLSNAEELVEMLDHVGYGAKDISLDVTGWKLGSAKNMQYMFRNIGGCESDYWNNDEKLEHDRVEIKGLATWDVSTVTDMSEMFAYIGWYADNLDFNWDLTSWDTRSLENASNMFAGFAHDAKNVEINLARWNTSKVKDMRSMFINIGSGENTESVKISASGWDVDGVETMYSMFSYCGVDAPSLIIDLSGWNVSDSTDTSSMFYGTGRSIGWTKPSWYIPDEWE